MNEVEVLSAAYSRELFDTLCRNKLGISAHEFVQQMKAGAYKNSDCGPVDELIILLPFWEGIDEN